VIIVSLVTFVLTVGPCYTSAGVASIRNYAAIYFRPAADMIRLSTPRALLYGTLVVGILDLADAFVFFGLRGVRPIRILQSIASGLLGREAFAGAAGTAFLGAALHFFIAFMVVATFFVASRYVAILRRAPIWSGLIYGIVVYLVMNFVVLPLSAAGRGTPLWPVVTNGLIIHMLGVGLPSSLVASRVPLRSIED
jgi:hypothetical protein